MKHLLLSNVVLLLLLRSLGGSSESTFRSDTPVQVVANARTLGSNINISISKNLYLLDETIRCTVVWNGLITLSKFKIVSSSQIANVTTATNYLNYLVGGWSNKERDIQMEFKWELLLGKISFGYGESRLSPIEDVEWSNFGPFQIVLVNDKGDSVVASSDSFKVGPNIVDLVLNKDGYYPGETIFVNFTSPKNMTSLFDANNYVLIFSVKDKDKPLHYNVVNAVQHINLWDLELEGEPFSPLEIVVDWTEPGMYRAILISVYNNYVRSLSDVFTVKKLTYETTPLIAINKSYYYPGQGIAIYVTREKGTPIGSTITIDLQRSNETKNGFDNNGELSCCYNGGTQNADWDNFIWNSSSTTMKYSAHFKSLQPGRYIVALYVGQMHLYHENRFLLGVSKSFELKEPFKVRMPKTKVTQGEKLSLELYSPYLHFEDCIPCQYYQLRIIPVSFLQLPVTENCGPEGCVNVGSTIDWASTMSIDVPFDIGLYLFSIFSTGHYDWNTNLVTNISNSSFQVVEK